MQAIASHVRIIGTRWMGICPKKAVIAINASRPAAIFVVPVGTQAEDMLHITPVRFAELGCSKHRV
jgi:hypothetical protein